MSWIESKAKSIAEFVYRNFEAKGSGNMILLTTMAGIALSTIAQTIAIITIFVIVKYIASSPYLISANLISS